MRVPPRSTSVRLVPFCLVIILTFVTPLIGQTTIAIEPQALPNAQQNSDYSQQLTASGGTSPYGFAVTSGTLPTGFSLSNGGVLAGKTSQSGAFAFDVTATD